MDARPDDRDDDAELEQLLAGGLAEAGRRGGRKGAGRPGAAGGGLGARFAARILRTTHHEQEVALGGSSPDDPELVKDVVSHLGKVVRTASDGDGGVAVRGVIGAGWLNMNPAVVDVRLRPGGRLVVHAAAKEGLIRQRTAEGAVRRVVAALSAAGAARESGAG